MNYVHVCQYIKDTCVYKYISSQTIKKKKRKKTDGITYPPAHPPTNSQQPLFLSPQKNNMHKQP